MVVTNSKVFLLLITKRKTYVWKVYFIQIFKNDLSQDISLFVMKPYMQVVCNEINLPFHNQQTYSRIVYIMYSYLHQIICKLKYVSYLRESISIACENVSILVLRPRRSDRIGTGAGVRKIYETFSWRVWHYLIEEQIAYFTSLLGTNYELFLAGFMFSSWSMINKNYVYLLLGTNEFEIIASIFQLNCI